MFDFDFKIKAECPLCKQPFKSIIHNVRSNVDYDQYHVEAGEPRCVLSDLMHSFNFDLIQVDRSFRYRYAKLFLSKYWLIEFCHLTKNKKCNLSFRSTMTREYFRELAETFLVQNNLYNNDFYQIPPMVPLDPAPTHNVRFSNRLHSSVRMRGTTEFRKKIYSRDLWVQDLADISGRYRECTPQFYR